MKRSTFVWIILIAVFTLFSMSGFLLSRYKQMSKDKPIDGIECSSESVPLKMHIHAHLAIFVNGRKIVVPEGIGIRESEGCVYWLHTHANDGVIHVESPVVRQFTLGQFFDIWKQKLSDTQVGQFSNGTNRLKVYVNGKPYTGDPRNITLQSHMQIVLEAGPKFVPPMSFTWPADLPQ